MNAGCELMNVKRLFARLAIWVLCVILPLASFGCKGKKARESGRDQRKEVPAAEQKLVFKSSLAGSWYLADGNELRQQISTFYDNADVQSMDDVIALILPHAGYAYSGQTAVCGVKIAGGNYQRIIVVGPTHSLWMEDLLAVPRATHYQTPIGEVPLDVELIDRLLKYPLFQVVPAAHEQEHSIQIEIPLLQFKRQTFKLVPIVVGHCSYDTIVRAGNILKSFADDSTLMVASSDFVHYGPRYEYVPFTDDVAAKIKKLDMGVPIHEFLSA